TRAHTKCCATALGFVPHPSAEVVIMTSRSKLSFMLCALMIAIDSGQPVRADVVVDWNQTACDVIATVGPGGPGHRLMAVTQVAVFEAVNAIDPRYASYLPRIQAPSGASIDAAVAAA